MTLPHRRVRADRGTIKGNVAAKGSVKPPFAFDASTVNFPTQRKSFIFLSRQICADQWRLLSNPVPLACPSGKGAR